MKRVLTAALAALSIGIGACGGKHEPEFGIPDQQAIRAATSTLETSFNAKDVDKILTLYTENSVFMPPNKPMLRGRDSLKQFYDGLLKAGSKDLKMTPGDVAGHGPLAYESGSYSMMNGDVPDRDVPAGQRHHPGRGAQAGVLRRPHEVAFGLRRRRCERAADDPRAGAERWRVLRAQALADGMMDAAVALTLERRRPPTQQSLPTQERWRGHITGALESMEEQLPDLTGILNIGHIAFAVALGYLDFRYAETAWRKQHPGLATWYDPFAQRPAMQQTLPSDSSYKLQPTS